MKLIFRLYRRSHLSAALKVLAKSDREGNYHAASQTRMSPSFVCDAAADLEYYWTYGD